MSWIDSNGRKSGPKTHEDISANDAQNVCIDYWLQPTHINHSETLIIIDHFHISVLTDCI